MKTKKLISAVLSTAMLVSMYTSAIAQTDPNNKTFDSNKCGCVASNGWYTDVSFDSTKDFGNNSDSGSLKVTGQNGDNFTTGIKISDFNFTAGKTYKITAQVYGETVTDGSYVAITKNESYIRGYLMYAPGFMNSNGEYNSGIADNTKVTYLKQGEWCEVSGYIAAQSGSNDIYIRFPKANGVVCYVDNVVAQEITSKEYFDLFEQGPKTQTAKTNALDYAFASLDATKTQNVLAVGESTTLEAYLQSYKDGAQFVKNQTTLGDLIREKADNTKVTADSDNPAVADYENGTITAKSVGVANIKFTYADGQTGSVTFTVVPQSSKSFDLETSEAKALRVPMQDPIDPDNDALVYFGNNQTDVTIDTEINANEPFVISFRMFNALDKKNSTQKKSGMQLVHFNFNGDSVNVGTTNVDGCLQFPNSVYVVNADGSVKQSWGPYITNVLVSGWNNIVITGSLPKINSNDTHSYLTLYANGKKIDEFEYRKTQDASKATKPDPNNIILKGADTAIIDDFKIATMKDALRITETVPVNGAKISVYDSVSVIFNNPADIADDAVYIVDGEGSTVENVTVTKTNTQVTLKPKTNFAPLTSFKLMIDESKILEKGTTNALGTGVKELISFTTMSVEESNKTRITFDSANANAFSSISTNAETAYSQNKDYNENGGGSVKYTLTSDADVKTGVKIAIPADKLLTDKKAYKITAQVYGENVSEKAYATISSWSANGDKTVDMGYYQYSDGMAENREGTLTDTVADKLTNLKQNAWTEVIGYAVGNGNYTKDVYIRFPQGTANEDVYYIDNVVIEEVPMQDYLALFPQGPSARYSFDAERDRSFSTLDVQKTKAVLTKGEETELKAYIQYIETGKTTGKPEVSAAETSMISAISANTGVASYADGKIKANGIGQTVITFTYNAPGISATQKLLVVVRPEEAESYVYDTTNSWTLETVDPLDADNKVLFTAGRNYQGNNKETSVSWSKPFAVSFKTYYAGAYKSDKTLRNLRMMTFRFGSHYSEGVALGGDGAIEFNSGNGPFAGTDNLVAGWNKIDYSFTAPYLNSEDGKYYTTVTAYVNGENSGSVERVVLYWDNDQKIFTNGTASWGDKVYLVMPNGIICDDVTIFQMPESEPISDIFEINDIVIKAGDTVISNKADLNGKSNITVSCTLKNGLSEEQEYTVIAAIYNDSNKLIDTVFTKGKLAAGETSSAVTTEAMDMTKYEEGSYTLKIFVWDSFANAYPLIADVNVPLN